LLDISSAIPENQHCIQENDAMALAQIIDLEERRRARVTHAASTSPTISPTISGGPSMWCYVWMPVYFWYVA
jgi:hypothetical protein